MKTIGKRINPAFTMVQPLPVWPEATRGPLSSTAPRQDRCPTPAPVAKPAPQSRGYTSNQSRGKVFAY